MTSMIKAALLGLLMTAGPALAIEPVEPPNDFAAPPADAMKLGEGLHYKVLTPGSDEQLTEKFVKFEVTGWTRADGETRFNAAEEGSQSQELAALETLLPGFASAIAEMTVGEQRRWWIDAPLLLPAWGQFVPGDYTFEISVIGQTGPLPAPDNVAEAPASAATTDSGLRFVIMQDGTGEINPVDTDTARVHYSGWTTDGEMFDSSVIREEPADFPVNGLIKGMTEGLKTMVVGEKKRLWIPQDLAYGENPRPGAPKGMLVFDVELLEINPVD